MGCKVGNTGISIQLVNSDATPNGPPVYGRYAALYGKTKQEIADLSLTADEHAFRGSADWLTFIAVADSEEKLTEIVKGSGTSTNPVDTSGSSRRVQIEVNVGGIRHSYKDRLTIASGPLLFEEKKLIVNVNQIQVLPADIALSDLGSDNPLVRTFVGNSPTGIEQINER